VVGAHRRVGDNLPERRRLTARTPERSKGWVTKALANHDVQTNGGKTGFWRRFLWGGVGAILGSGLIWAIIHLAFSVLANRGQLEAKYQDGHMFFAVFFAFTLGPFLICLLGLTAAGLGKLAARSRPGRERLLTITAGALLGAAGWGFIDAIWTSLN